MSNDRGRLVLFLLLLGMVLSGFLDQGNWGISSNDVPPYEFDLSYDPLHTLPWLFAVLAFVLPFFVELPKIESERPAGLFRRFVALCIDLFVCSLVLMMPATLMAYVLDFLRTPLLEIFQDLSEGGLHSLITGLFFPGLMVAILCFYCWPAAAGRQSAGDLLLGIEQRSTARPTLWRSIGHTVVGFLTLSLLFIGLFVALIREDRRMWHDLVFDTRTVR